MWLDQLIMNNPRLNLFVDYLTTKYIDIRITEDNVQALSEYFEISVDDADALMDRYGRYLYDNENEIFLYGDCIELVRRLSSEDESNDDFD